MYLLHKIQTADDIEMIEVVRRPYGLWWARTGNRRLYVYKALYNLRIIDTIPVFTRDRLMRRLTTDYDCDGKSIRIRPSRGGLQSTAMTMSDITDAWERSAAMMRFPRIPMSESATRGAGQSFEQDGDALDRQLARMTIYGNNDEQRNGTMNQANNMIKASRLYNDGGDNIFRPRFREISNRSVAYMG